MSAKPYSRRLSSMERYSLVINEICHYEVNGVLEGSGDLDVQTLQRAVAVASEANPGVRVRLRGVLGWSRWVDSGITPSVELIENSDWDGESEQGAPFLQRKLDPLRGGAVTDVFLVRNRSGKVFIIIRSLHAALDGRGMLHWVSDIFRVLRGETPVGSSSSITDLDVQDAHQEQAQAAEVPAVPESFLPVLQHSEPAGKPVVETASLDHAPLRYVWRRVFINRNVSSLLPKTAIFLAEWARKNGEGDVGFTVPVDYRGLRTEEMSVGNLTGYLRINLPADATPRTFMQQLNQGLRSFADCRQAPGAKLLRWVPIAFLVSKLKKQVNYLLFARNKELPSGGLVSMGSFKNEMFSCPGFTVEKAYGIPGSVGKLNVIFATYPDSSAVIFSVPEVYNRQGQLDALVQAYQAHFSQ